MKQKTGCRIGAAKVIGATNVDIELEHHDVISFGQHSLEVRATPGHTNGCLTYVTEDQARAFTGDTLLIRGCGRADFQQGNASTLYDSIREQILSLPDSCLIYPGHDYSGRTVSSVAEEKAFNARIGGGANKGDFVGYMDAMRLPHPKHIDIALPANMASGKPEDGGVPTEPAWAPVTLTFAGVMEVEPAWVAGQLRDRLTEIPRDKPVLAICRSGRRSAMAAGILRNAGFEQIASVAGGILRWKDEGLALKS